MTKHTLIKRGLILAAIMVSTLLVTGCGEEEQVEVVEPVQEKHEGVLKSLGGMTVGDGTHLLEVSGGTTLRLRSDLIDLNSEKYLQKKVEVKGIVTQAEDGKDLMDVKSIDLAEDESETDEAIQGEPKEYTNTDLGFKLTYLDNWTVKDGTAGVSFKAPLVVVKADDDDDEEDEEAVDIEISKSEDVDEILITRLSNSEKKSLESFLKIPADANENILNGWSQMKVGVDRLDGLKRQGSVSASENPFSIEVYLTRGTYVYNISFIGVESGNSIKNQNTYFSMVSSLQFIGMDDVEDTEDEVVDEPATVPEVDEPIEEQVIIDDEPEEAAVVDPPEADIPSIDPVEVVVAPEANSSAFGIISQSISGSIGTIAPESSESGSWYTTSFEFVDPNYVYVDYSDGSENRRVLLTYNDSSNEFSTSIVGYFKPGETTSWERVAGDNPVETNEKTIVTIGDEGAQAQATVKEGYRYFESLPYDFMAQYPSNWYYGGSSGGSDVMHHYGFSNNPVEGGNEIVSIDVISGSLPSGTPISIGGHSGVKVISGDVVAIYISGENGKLYKVHGESNYESYVIDIAASIIPN